MERIRFISHKGTEILLLDCSGCKAVELFPIIARARTLIASRPKGSLRTLTDVTGAEVNDALAQQVKAFSLHNKPYVKAAAVVGIEGVKQIILNSVELASRREFQVFDAVDAAKDWLAEQK